MRDTINKNMKEILIKRTIDIDQDLHRKQEQKQKIEERKNYFLKLKQESSKLMQNYQQDNYKK